MQLLEIAKNAEVSRPELAWARGYLGNEVTSARGRWLSRRINVSVSGLRVFERFLGKEGFVPVCASTRHMSDHWDSFPLCSDSEESFHLNALLNFVSLWLKILRQY